MSSRAHLSVIALGAIFIAAVLQSGEFITFFGIKPNLVLVLLAVFSFFTRHFFSYALLAIFSAFVLSFTPGIWWEGGALVLVAFLFFYMRDRFLSPGLLVSIFFTVLGTVLFYLLISPLVLYDELGVIFKEVAYNALIGVLLYSLTSFVYEKKGGSSIR